MKRHAYGLPPLNSTDRDLLLALDHVVGYTPGVATEENMSRVDDYLMARHALERRLRGLCRAADIGFRVRHVLKTKAREG